jgi:hypothetical protein
MASGHFGDDAEFFARIIDGTSRVVEPVGGHQVLSASGAPEKRFGQADRHTCSRQVSGVGGEERTGTVFDCACFE